MNDQETVKFQDMMLLDKVASIKKYGEPHKEEKFVLNDSLRGFRVGLTTVFTKEERMSRSIVINEVTWSKDSRTWLTVWYQIEKSKAVPKHMYVWKKGTDFFTSA